MQEQIAWVKSAKPKPGVEEILYPGEPEYRTAPAARRRGHPGRREHLAGDAGNGRKPGRDDSVERERWPAYPAFEMSGAIGARRA